MDDLLLDLKKNIFYRAKIFIDDMGEFVPFGSELIGTEINPDSADLQSVPTK